MGLIKVLLVDDNRLALEYLKHLVDWEKNGFTVVGSAIDGMEALRLYRKLQPHLVITDISMPMMSGIELSEKIYQINRHTKIIFLSSYDEFDYARSALRLQVSDYILKHELDGEMLEKRLLQVKREMEEYFQMNTIYVEKTLQEFFRSPTDDAREEFMAERYTAVAVTADMPLEPFREFVSEQMPEEMDKKIREVCKKLDSSIFAVCRMEEFQYLLFFKDSILRSGKTYYEWKSKLEQFVGTPFTITILLERGTMREQKDYYYSHQRALKAQYFSAPSSVVYSEWIKENVEKSEIVPGSEKMLYLIASGEKDSVMSYLDEVFLDVLHREDYGALVDAVSLFLDILKKYDGKLKNLKNGTICHLVEKTDVQKWYTGSRIMVWMKEKYALVMEILKDNRSMQYTRYTKMAVDFIYNHYQDQNLSVEDIAGSIGIGVNYLNQVFRDEMDTTLHRFLSLYRIEKAKVLLSDNQMKIGDIPRAVGYANSQYFSKVFKKATGMTPYEYRQRN